LRARAAACSERAFASFNAGIGERRHAAHPRHSFYQNVLSLAVKLGREDADARCISIGPGERFHQSLPNYIVCNRNDRDAFGGLPHGASCHAPTSIDDIRLGCDQLCRVLRKQIEARSKGAEIDREVLSFDEPAKSYFAKKSTLKGTSRVNGDKQPRR
jgi:hypothetical protein